MVTFKMHKEKLIEEVQKYKLLYDPSDPKYSDPIKKEVAWREISRTLAISVDTCKKTWINLREAHRRAIKKRRTKSCHDKKWQYEDEMSFLLPHYRKRATASSLLRDSDQESTGNDDSQLYAPDLQSDASITEDSRPQCNCSNSKRPKRIMEVEDESSAALIKYLIEEKETNKDEIDAFFSGIAATVKKFSEYNKAMIKSQVFNLVSQMELREINDVQNNYHDSNNYSTAAETSGYTITTNDGSQTIITQPNTQEFDSRQQDNIDTQQYIHVVKLEL